MRASLNFFCRVPSMWKRTYVSYLRIYILIHELLTINAILYVKSVFPVKCHQKLCPIAFLKYMIGPHNENLEITHIKIIASVDARVYAVVLLFRLFFFSVFKNSVYDAQALFFHCVEAEIYQRLSIHYGEKYALLFHVCRFCCIIHIVDVQSISWKLLILGYIVIISSRFRKS